MHLKNIKQGNVIYVSDNVASRYIDSGWEYFSPEDYAKWVKAKEKTEKEQAGGPQTPLPEATDPVVKKQRAKA